MTTIRSSSTHRTAPRADSFDTIPLIVAPLVGLVVLVVTVVGGLAA